MSPATSRKPFTSPTVALKAVAVTAGFTHRRSAIQLDASRNGGSSNATGSRDVRPQYATTRSNSRLLAVVGCPTQSTPMLLSLHNRLHREEAEEETVRAAVERRSDYARQQQAQAELVERKMRLLMSNASEDPNALNHTIANAIAAKQSGGAVHSLMTTGYGYE